MRFLPVAVFVLGLAGSAAVARADTLKVPSDDYPTIQSAVDAAVEGDTVLVLPGVYTETVDIVGKTGIRLKGKGFPTISPGDGDGINVADSTGIEVTGFVIDQALTGIVISLCSDVTVTRTAVSDSAFDAFRLALNAGVVISRCQVAGTGSNGVEDDASEDLVVEKCDFSDVAGTALFLSAYNIPGSGSDRARVSKNAIASSGLGMALGGSDVVVEKNRVQTTGGYGIYFDSSTSPANCVISKNVIVTNYAQGIQFAGNAFMVDRNRLTNSSIVENGYNHVIDRNAVTGGNYGIYVYGSSTTVTRNTVRATGTGIVLTSYLASVEGNKVRDTEGDGIVVTSTGQGPVAGNKVYGAGGAGFRVEGSGSTITGNNATDSQWGFLVTGTSNTFSRNRASGNVVFDLADTNAPGANTYAEDNRFGTQQIPYVD